MGIVIIITIPILNLNQQHGKANSIINTTMNIVTHVCTVPIRDWLSYKTPLSGT